MGAKHKKMKTVRFHELNASQKIDALSKMITIISNDELSLPCDENRLAIEIEQGYDPNQDFCFCLEGDEIRVSLKEFA